MIDSSDDLDGPKYAFAKAKALEVWKVLANSNVPVVLRDVVNALSIVTKAEDFKLDGFSRMDSAGLCFIMYKKSCSEVRQRFTVAHEIGHIVLEHITYGEDTRQHSNGSQEKEANAFASALLIPSVDLKPFMKDEDKTIDDVMARYKVSKEAATYAILGNNLLNKVKV